MAAKVDVAQARARLQVLAIDMGFDAVGVSDVDLSACEPQLMAWLEAGFHGEMDYMARHGATRARPAALVPGTVRVITARMNYLPKPIAELEARNRDSELANISFYALGRDYHKVLRRRLARLAQALQSEFGAFGYRAFTDSAPVMEVALAQKAGLGWRGKHTLLLSREAGSLFFLGELFTDLPLPVDSPVDEYCGTCFACATACPTGAIVEPYKLDARRCISYLTIELQGSIPQEFRPLIGNRVYGCDDCQTACPWNKYAQVTREQDFAVIRNGLDTARLTELFSWNESEFEVRLAGSAIRRIGHERWLRNLAVGLGNARRAAKDSAEAATNVHAIDAALAARADHPSALVREHVAWARAQTGAD
jgi:epoxyqueuosine reductase